MDFKLENFKIYFQKELNLFLSIGFKIKDVNVAKNKITLINDSINLLIILELINSHAVFNRKIMLYVYTIEKDEIKLICETLDLNDFLTFINLYLNLKGKINVDSNGN